jgi:histidyl-tRNA synthetase
MTDRKIYKPKPISGFPEWLPEYRAVEQAWMDHFRRVFESYGYANIETPAVEELGVLAAKGEVDKEIYVLERLHKDDESQSLGESLGPQADGGPRAKPEGPDTARLALHFDQTVPMARYVAQHFANLNFPFKRYQMQKVWRGERPQLGRAREFYQCDIDVIGIDHLPLHFDAEMPAVMYECLAPMTAELGRVQIRVNNRKIILGLIEGLNITDPSFITRTTDKMDKIGADKTAQILRDEGGLPQPSVDAIMNLVTVKARPNDLAAFNRIKAQKRHHATRS